MKFRKLTLVELQELEPEFVQFLAANTVTGDDWVKLKTVNPEKAEHLIELFSDIVIGKTLDKLEFLEFRTRNDIKIFHCEKEQIKLMGLSYEGTSALDFTQDLSPEKIKDLIEKSDVKLKMYSAEKKYTPDRSSELFKMLNNGCNITNNSLYIALESLQANFH